jgi:hypothetical protein
MTSRSLFVAAAVVLSAGLIIPAESAAQRQRWPGGDSGGGGRQESGGGRGGGGARARDGGGAPRQNGGSRERNDGGGARRQDGGGRSEVRSAQPRDRGGDRAERGRRDAPSAIRESAPPPQTNAAPPPEVRSEGGSQQDRRQAQRRFPNDADRAGRGNATRGDGNRDRGGIVANDNRARSGSRVAVPRVGRAPDARNRNFPRGYNTYRNYGGRNIYIVPRGRTFLYYPRYYYRPYTFGYGPAGRGHFYFDLYYNSYIWHPYSVYRYGSYGTFGYPVGELRLKVRPRDAQVFIDGYYAGRVDDFDGIFQSLRLEEGEYQVEIVLPGYEPLAFDVRIFPGEKTTYEGDLIPEP